MQAVPILYVEDDDNDVFLLRRAFKKAGVAAPLIVIGNGMDAARYLAGEGDYADRAQFPLPGLMLLDLNLPGLSGLDLLKRLNDGGRIRDLPVIIFSSSPDSGDKNKARQLGAVDYLVKPVDMSDFFCMIEQLKSKWPREFCGQPSRPDGCAISDPNENRWKTEDKEN